MDTEVESHVDPPLETTDNEDDTDFDGMSMEDILPFLDRFVIFVSFYS